MGFSMRELGGTYQEERQSSLRWEERSTAVVSTDAQTIPTDGKESE